MAAAVEVAERAASDAKDQSSKADRERRSAEEHAAESAAALARERADRKADAASFAAERKDLQVRDANAHPRNLLTTLLVRNAAHGLDAALTLSVNKKSCP